MIQAKFQPKSTKIDFRQSLCSKYSSFVNTARAKHCSGQTMLRFWQTNWSECCWMKYDTKKYWHKFRVGHFFFVFIGNSLPRHSCSASIYKVDKWCLHCCAPRQHTPTTWNWRASSFFLRHHHRSISWTAAWWKDKTLCLLCFKRLIH